MKVIYGSLVGSSFQLFSYSRRYLMLSSHEPRDLVDWNDSFIQVVGTLLIKISDMSISIYSVIVSSPLLASSISARDLIISLIKRAMTSHSWINTF